MELSISSIKLPARCNLEERAKLFKNAGFTAMDYYLNGMSSVKPYHWFNSPDYRKIAEEKRRTVETIGLKINQTHGP